MTERRELLTFGHGRLSREELTTLIGGAGITRLVDVRRFPGSRHNAAAASGQVEDLARELGVYYRHEPRLGGRRHLTRTEDALSPDTWWQVAAFRAYAAWTRSEEFRAGLADLLTTDLLAPDLLSVDPQAQRSARTAIMCSEAVWWRCHRRIVADVLVLEHGVTVTHLMHDGRLTEHLPSEGARLDAEGHVVWDGALSPEPPISE